MAKKIVAYSCEYKCGRNVLTSKSRMEEHENSDVGIRKLHKKASGGDQEALDKLANVCLELNDKVIRELESKLSKL